jgi:hypothetical protein
MKFALIGLALLIVCPGALAQAGPTSTPANPIAITPGEPAKAPPESPKAAAIRSRLESFGYDNVTDLDRDSAGLWHARALKDNEVISVIVDKGGRIIPQRH